MSLSVLPSPRAATRSKSSPSQGKKPNKENKPDTVLIFLSVGIAVAVLAVAFVVRKLWQKKRKSAEEKSQHQQQVERVELGEEMETDANLNPTGPVHKLSRARMLSNSSRSSAQPLLYSGSSRSGSESIWGYGYRPSSPSQMIPGIEGKLKIYRIVRPF